MYEGARDNTMASILGTARQVLKMDKEELFQYGMSQNSKRFKPPLSEKDVRRISGSIGGYEIKPTGGIAFPETTQVPAAEIVVPKLNKVPYPEFPEYVMWGTSLYEGFVKPVCDVNSRIPYFMFLPAAALMMNYLGTKVKVPGRNQIPSFFMVLIGEKGRAIKSSSVEDAIEYLNVSGVHHASSETRNAEGTCGRVEGT